MGYRKKEKLKMATNAERCSYSTQAVRNSKRISEEKTAIIREEKNFFFVFKKIEDLCRIIKISENW